MEAQLAFAHLKTDTRLLDPYTRPDMQRIMEDYASKGVTALVQLTSRSQTYGVFNVVVFNRAAGKVDFEVYNDLQVQVAITLITSKKVPSTPVVPSYPPSNANALNTWRPTAPNAPPPSLYGYPTAHAPQYAYSPPQPPNVHLHSPKQICLAITQISSCAAKPRA